MSKRTWTGRDFLTGFLLEYLGSRRLCHSRRASPRRASPRRASPRHATPPPSPPPRADPASPRRG